MGQLFFMTNPYRFKDSKFIPHSIQNKQDYGRNMQKHTYMTKQQYVTNILQTINTMKSIMTVVNK